MAKQGNVDERIVEMQFDNTQFEKNANTTISTLEKLKRSLNLEGAAKGFDELEKSSGQLDFSKLQNGVEAIGEKFTMMGMLGITAMQRISNAAIDMGLNLGKTLMGLNGISEGFGRYAEKSNHVKTIMTATGESIERVSEVLDDLNWFTDETSYKFTDMVNTMGKFTSAGVELDVAKQAVEGIALWAAESGQNATTASRAMFQLAQAYGRGTIQLQDWMSVEQANMSTAKIMNELIEEGGKAAENAIAKYGGFRDSLRSGWLTTEIFNKVMQKYSEGVTSANYENGKFTRGVTEMSKAAFAAAQEARTYKDAIDAVKEAVSTGWSHTFELVFGNAEEAAVVWTDLANTLIAVSDKFTAFRNDVLEVWNDIGGRDKMVDAAYSMFSGIGKIGNAITGSFAKNLHIGKTLDELKNSEWATSQEARELISEIESLEEQITRFAGYEDGAKLIDEYQSRIDELTGSLRAMDRGHFLDDISEGVQNFANKFKYLAQPYDRLNDLQTKINNLRREQQALSREQLKAGAAEALEDQIKALRDEQNELNSLVPLVEAFRAVWDGAISILKVGKEIFVGIAEALKPIKEVLSTLINPVLSFFRAIGRLVSAFNDVLLKSGIIKESLIGAGNTIADFLTPIVEKLIEVIDWVTTKINKFADSLEKGLSPIGGWLESAKKAILGFFESLDFKLPKIDGVSDIFSKIGKIFESFWKSTGPIAQKVGKAISGLWDVLTTVFGKISDIVIAFLKDLGKAMGSGENVIQNIYNFVAALMQLWLMLSAKWTMDANPLESFSDALYGVYRKFTGDAIKSIAEGLLLIAGALFVVSLIDTDKLLTSAGVLLVLMGAITKMVSIFTRIQPTLDDAVEEFTGEGGIFKRLVSGLEGFFKGFSGIIKGAQQATKFYAIGSLIKSIGISLLLISGALKIIGTLEPQQMIASVLALAAVFKMLQSFMKNTTQFDGFKVDGIIKMAVSLMIIASAVKKLGSIETGTLLKGLAAMGAVLLEIAGFQALVDHLSRQNLFGSDKGLAGIGAGMIFIAASMIIFAKAIKSLGNLSVDELNQGLGALVVLLAALAVSMFVLQKTPVLFIAAGFLVLSVAIAALAATVALLGKAKLSTIGKGLLGLIVPLIAITACLKVLGDSTLIGVNLINSALAIAIVAAAMNLLVIPLIALGKLNLDQVIIALIGLAGALGIIAIAAKTMEPLTDALLKLAGAIALFGIGIAAVGVGLTLISTSLVAAVTAIMASIGIVIAGLGGIIAALVMAISEAAGSIALGIGVLGAAILSGLTMLIRPTANLIGELIDAIIQVLADKGPSIGENLARLFIELLQVVDYYLPILVDEGVKMAIDFINGIANGIVEHTDDALAAVHNLMYSLGYFAISALEELAGDLGFGGKLIEQTMEGWKQNIKDGMVDVGDEANSKMADSLTGVKDTGKAGGSDFIGGVVEGANESMPALDEIKNSISSYFSEGFGTTEGGSLFGANLLENEKNAMLEKAPEFSEVGAVVDQSIFSNSSTTGLVGEGGAVGEGSASVNGANLLFDNILDTLIARAPEAATVGEDTTTNFVTGMDNKKPDVEAKSQEVADASEQPISELPPKFEDHSKNAMQGLINGVDAMWDSVVGKFAALAAECNAQMSINWQEHSPAKAFIKHSRNAMLGLAIGVDENASVPITAMRNVAVAMIDTVDETMNGMSNGRVQPTISPVVDLTNASNTVNSIGSMIAAQRSAAVAASMEINSQVSQIDELVDVATQILGSIQNGSDLYLDDGMIAGRINRRLGVL